jgi:predicted DNA-binding transcriptional regulator AlpA
MTNAFELGYGSVTAKLVPPVPATSDTLATPRDLAERLQVPVATIYAWNHKQTGPPPIRVGKHIRYRWADVERWLDRQASQSRIGRP